MNSQAVNTGDAVNIYNKLKYKCTIKLSTNLASSKPGDAVNTQQIEVLMNIELNHSPRK